MAVVALWLIVAALAGLYIWHSRDDGSSAGAATVASSSPTTTLVPGTSLAPATTAARMTSTTAAPTTTTTAAPTTTTTTEPPPLTVAAGGDVLGDREVGNYMDKYGGESVFEKVKPFMVDADLAFINLEGSISDKGARATWKEFTFRARPALTSGLVWGGIDVVSLANNHTLDYGSKAMLDCITRLDEAGVAHPGAGADSAAAAAPAVLETPAGTVGVIAASEITQAFAAGAGAPGTNFTSAPNERLVAQVAAAAKEVDFLVVSFHWGTEYEAVASGHQQSLAHKVIDAGADLVLGHHPHVIQGLEIYKDRLIAYSLGDYIFDHYSRATGESFVLQITIPQEGGPSGKIIPVYLHDVWGVPAPVSGGEADAILDRLARLSSALGLELTRSGDYALFGADAE